VVALPLCPTNSFRCDGLFYLSYQLAGLVYTSSKVTVLTPLRTSPTTEARHICSFRTTDALVSVACVQQTLNTRDTLIRRLCRASAYFWKWFVI